ncbi:MAG: hypothetical protein HYZ01_06765 [Ignavibacteriales bacterium]|nr:hypothetical protein [Ignavibacteriales bacterium]
MRHIYICPILLLFVLSESFGQSYGLGNADPSVFSRFRIPDTDLRSIWIASNLSYNSDKFSSLSSGWGNKNSFFFTNLRPSYYLIQETDDRFFHLNSSVGVLYRRSTQEDEGPGLPANYYSKLNTFETDLQLFGVYRNYTGPGETFYSLESDITVQFVESRRDQPVSSIENQYMGQKQQSYRVTVGIGSGKMRNVTPVVSALRFQERLKQLNLISGDLGERTIEALAQQFYRQGYYGQVHVRPDKFFWQEVGRTLSAEGVSLDGINQYGNSYLRETPGELRFERNEGAVGVIGLQFMYDNTYDSNSFPRIFERFFLLANLSLGYSHELTLNSQVALNFSVSAGPNLTKNSAVRQLYAADARLGYAYELTDRLVVMFDNRFTLSFSNANRQGRDLTNTFSAAISYFVEDQLSLTGSSTWRFTDVKYASTFIHEERINNNVQVGLSYYIWRGFIQSPM